MAGVAAKLKGAGGRAVDGTAGRRCRSGRWASVPRKGAARVPAPPGPCGSADDGADPTQSPTPPPTKTATVIIRPATNAPMSNHMSSRLEAAASSAPFRSSIRRPPAARPCRRASPSGTTMAKSRVSRCFVRTRHPGSRAGERRPAVGVSGRSRPCRRGGLRRRRANVRSGAPPRPLRRRRRRDRSRALPTRDRRRSSRRAAARTA